jgi:undecaprenyl-diphosphatase
MKELYDEYKVWKNPIPGAPKSLFASSDETVALLVGTVVSGIVGYFAIAWLMHFLKRYSLYAFVGYRILLGIGILMYLAIR